MADLVDGCKLQMRGSLTAREQDSQMLPTHGLGKMYLPPSIQEGADMLLRLERSRSCVYGSWLDNAQQISHAQRASIAVFAGPNGSGKRTLAKSLAFDLQRLVKLVHVADLVSASSLGDTLHHLNAAIADAKLSDAVIVLDGFEHVMIEEGGGASGEAGIKIHILLSRLLDCLFLFPGLVLLICHIDGPQNISLQRNFATKLSAFVRFANPPYDVRAKLWEDFLPKKAPVSKALSFIELGRKFDLNPGSIRSAVARAAAEAFARGSHQLDHSNSNGAAIIEIRQKDLLLAGEQEVAKLRDGNFDLVSKLFT